MQEYRVDLDVYHGPLDLLLYLIRRDEIDILNIPIAHITEQYLRFIQGIKTLDINLAGEFLVMAATLMEIKSALILPPEQREGEEGAEPTTSEDPTDPRYELVQQLLAYKRFKDAAYALDRRREDFSSRFPVRPAPFEKEQNPDAPPPLELEDVSIWNLLEAFQGLMEQINVNQRTHQVIDDDTPLELHQADIVDRLEREGPMTLQKMFVGRKSLGELIGLFLATLELIRQRRVRVRQESPGTEIYMERVADPSEWIDANRAEEQPPPPKADPANPEDYDWPSESEKLRYQRRQQRRARGETVEEDAELEEDIRALEAEEAAPAVSVASADPQETAENAGPDDLASETPDEEIS